jgi:hypothetical protein
MKNEDINESPKARAMDVPLLVDFRHLLLQSCTDLANPTLTWLR